MGNLEDKIFIFEVINNDHDGHGFMLYEIKKNFLKPIKKYFERGWNVLMGEYESLNYLKNSKINEVITFQPDSEIVYSHPYELNTEEEIEMCENDGKWNRFEHLEVINSKFEEILKKDGIKLLRLNSKETDELTESLNFIPE